MKGRGRSCTLYVAHTNILVVSLDLIDGGKKVHCVVGLEEASPHNSVQIARSVHP